MIGQRLELAAYQNSDREKTLRALFEQAGCQDERLTEQSVRNNELPNVVCVLRGATDSTIIVGAHYDHVTKGMGVVDNWSGAALLPSLFQSLGTVPRKHTFIFIGFTDEERGLKGSRFYARHLTPAQIAQTRVMINLDSLGLGPTKIWLLHSDRQLTSEFEGIALEMKLPVEVEGPTRRAIDDSQSFIRLHVPTLMIHSVTPATWPILHSRRDTLKAIRFDDYYDTYRLLAAYLLFLDGQN